MSDRSQHLAIVVTAQDLASGKLGKVRSELAQLGPSGRLAAVGLGTAMKAAQVGGQAFGHLKDRITSLAGPLGFIGLGAAAFGVVGAFEQGVTKAESMALAVERLTAVTELNVHQASQLVAVTDRYGITSDQLVTIAAASEKTLGKLAETQAKGAKATKSAALAHLEHVKAQRQAAGESTTAVNKLIAEQKGRDQLAAKSATSVSKLTALDTKYGLNLVDAKGKVVDFATELNQLADFYNSGASASDKAYVASQLLLKGYAILTPILKLGAKGIAEVSAEADNLGLTLKTAQDVQNVKDFIAAQRDAKDAVGGLEVQLGLLVMPDLTAGLRSFSGFVADHQAEVKAFFTGTLHGAEDLAGFITGSLIPTVSGFAGSVKGAWDTMPAPIRDLLFKGIVADRTINWLIGVSPIHVIADVAEGALTKGLGGLLGGTFFQRGSFDNPMFVASVDGGLTGPGAGGAAGLLGKLFSFVGPALLVAGTVALATDISGINDPSHKLPNGKTFRGTNDVATSIGNVQRSIDQLTARAANGDTFAASQLAASKAEMARLLALQAAGLTSVFDKLPAGTSSDPMHVVSPEMLAALDNRNEEGAARLAAATAAVAALARAGAYRPKTQSAYVFALGETKHPGDKDTVRWANALTKDFQTSDSSTYQSVANLKASLTTLIRDQRYFATHHDPKDARLIGIDIAGMKRELASRLKDGTAAALSTADAVRRLQLNVTVPVQVNYSARDGISANVTQQIRAGVFHAGTGGP